MDGKSMDGKTTDVKSIQVCVDSYYSNLEVYVLLKSENGLMITTKTESLSLTKDQKMNIAEVVSQKEADFVFRWMKKNQKTILMFDYPLIRFLKKLKMKNTRSMGIFLKRDFLLSLTLQRHLHIKN